MITIPVQLSKNWLAVRPLQDRLPKSSSWAASMAQQSVLTPVNV